MGFIDKLRQIDDLQTAIKEYGVIPGNLLNKVNYKLRLEWNYTSNSMEGNSLTKRETRTVMVGVIDVNDKPIKDVMEIRNHDKVIDTIMKIGKGELNLSENRVKEIHRGIMFEEDPEKQKQIGEWKTTNNYMIISQNERYDFLPHSEVKEYMHKLINWVNAEKEKIDHKKKDASHPILIALKFHIDYLTIHPFYDGNGRSARILTNLILISYGYPPLYIKENEKQNYYRYLTDIQSYGGEPDLFYDFMAGLLLRSIKLITDTLEGKEIEDDDNIDKEIALFKRSLDKTPERKEIKSWLHISRIIENTGIPLFQKFISKLSQFDDLFHSHEHRIIFNTNSGNYDLQSRSGGFMLSMAQFPESLIKWLHAPTVVNGPITGFGVEYLLKGYKFSKPYDLPIFIQFSFDEYFYSICITVENSQADTLIEHNYDQSIASDEINNMINEVTKRIFSFIKDH